MKILIPGGHLTPALGLIDWLNNNQPDTEIVFAGRIYSQENLKQPAVEAYEVNKRKVPFIPVKTVKLGWSGFFSWLIKPFFFIISFVKALRIIQQEKPDVIMSFGGYVAVPFVLAGKIKGVPSLAHEGTMVVGLANKIIFKFAAKVAYSYPDLANFNLEKIKNKAVLTGTPLRSVLKTPQQAAKPNWLPFELNDKLLLVMGGNQGSKTINDFVAQHLHWLTKRYIVIHQCGRANKLYNYQQELSSAANGQGINPDRYFILPWIDAADLAWLYQHAFLALSRAGINTIEELIHYTLPSILVPLPHAHFAEQQRNAEFAAKHKAGVMLLQKDLTLDNLQNAINRIQQEHASFVANLAQLKAQTPQNAAKKLFKILTTLSNS